MYNISRAHKLLVTCLGLAADLMVVDWLSKV